MTKDDDAAPADDYAKHLVGRLRTSDDNGYTQNGMSVRCAAAQYIESLSPTVRKYLNAAIAAPIEEYSSEMASVLWWEFPVVEPPYVGHPDCCDWPGYHTHWTPLIVPEPPEMEG